MIHILTFHRADNYGAVLQNYALQKFLSLKGYEVDTLDYRCSTIDNEYIPRLLPSREQLKTANLHYKLLCCLHSIMSYNKIKQKHVKFESFRERYLLLSKVYNEDDFETDSIINQEDIYITGSDQVWNTHILKDSENKIFTLGFVKNGKTIAYAASAGNNQYISYKELSNIKKISYVSVRETELQRFLQKKIEREVTSVIDPTFLLDINVWKQLFYPIEHNGNKSLFLYYIESSVVETTRIALDYSKYSNAKIIYPCSFNRLLIGKAKCTLHFDPIEFIQNIYNANMIITSSFHAVAFSIIFEKPFIVVPHQLTGSRVTDLLEILGLSTRAVFSFEDYYKRRGDFAHINYSEVKGKLLGLIDSSQTFLLNAIDGLH